MRFNIILGNIRELVLCYGIAFIIVIPICFLGWLSYNEYMVTYNYHQFCETLLDNTEMTDAEILHNIQEWISKECWK